MQWGFLCTAPQNPTIDTTVIPTPVAIRIIHVDVITWKYDTYITTNNTPCCAPISQATANWTPHHWRKVFLKVYFRLLMMKIISNISNQIVVQTTFRKYFGEEYPTENKLLLDLRWKYCHFYRKSKNTKNLIFRTYSRMQITDEVWICYCQNSCCGYAAKTSNSIPMRRDNYTNPPAMHHRWIREITLEKTK